ncbi:MAG: hypothetical protein K2O00_02180 [Muribaculaceae bacterium]|nr:hypothetical protein [Muribaculaceae bacterium]
MLLSISTEAVLKQVYALSALRSMLTSTPDSVSPYLTEDNRQALIPILNEALSYIAAELLPYLEIVTPPSTLDDLIEAELTVDNLPAGICSMMESALAQRMLHIIHSLTPGNTGDNYRAMADTVLQTLLTIIRESAGASTGSIPWNGY